MPRRRGSLPCQIPKRVRLQHHKKGLVESKDDVGPAGSVPQAAQQKHDQEVQIRPRVGNPAAAERNVKVIAKPASSASCAALPELADRLRQVRKVEVLQELNPNIFPIPTAMSE